MTPPKRGAVPPTSDRHLIFDAHNDTLLDLHLPERGEGRTFFERSEHGHIVPAPARAASAAASPPARPRTRRRNGLKSPPSA